MKVEEYKKFLGMCNIDCVFYTSYCVYFLESTYDICLSDEDLQELINIVECSVFSLESFESDLFDVIEDFAVYWAEKYDEMEE